MKQFVNDAEFEQEYDTEMPEETVFEKLQKEDSLPMFAFWRVGEKAYKLKWSSTEIMSLESKYKCNLIDLMGDENKIPPLTTMLQMTHAAMAGQHHGIKLDHVKKLFEAYTREGGSIISFYTEVFIPIYAVSGFFPKNTAMDLISEMKAVSKS